MKRVFDLTLLIVLLPIFVPLLLVVGLTVRIALGSPVFFRQERGGYRGQRFMLWKFRSMTNERDAFDELLSDEDRLTPLGTFLRASSLDEIPCFFNLIRGELSFVGPRPFMSRYLPLYTVEQMRRHDVVPGITGWSQVNGRNSLTWEEKFALDLWYVDNRSFWLDLKILLLTARKVALRDDVNQEGAATMPLFEGSKSE